MLNRIYIIIGLLAIIVLAGAFLAPRFIQWSDYRSRMEELASNVLGTPVTIRGEIDFALLPQPRLKLADVLVGSPEEPAATVDSVEADFSLLDFLRDNYEVTRLVLVAPVMDFSVDESGFFGSGVTIANSGSGVALSQATIQNGTIRLMDRRSRENFVVDDLDGELKISTLSGPFQFQGTAVHKDDQFGVRFNSAAMDSTGSTRAAAAISGANFVLSTEGVLSPGMAPKFDGVMTYRQTPPPGENADDIRGDLVLESRVSGSTDRIVLSGYTLQPDENRSGMRLTGAASIQLGTRRSFDAVISGGVFSLPPRDANEDVASQPYELVRLLSELPAPLVPPMQGRVGIDLAEIGLRGFALREVRVDARTDGDAWTLEQFIAQLPGNTELRATGELDSESNAAVFKGRFSLASQRMDGLAQLWRKPDEANILFNQPGQLEGELLLGSDALGISNGMLTLPGSTHAVELRLGFGAEKRLDMVGHFDELGADGSAMLAALLPDVTSEPAFGISFPDGSFSLTAQNAQIAGQSGTDLLAEGQWSAGSIQFERLSAASWGGISVDTTLLLGGSLAEPQVSGSGRWAVADPQAPGLVAAYDLLELPLEWRTALALSAPADLLVDLTAPDENGLQTLSLGGALGAGDINLRAELGNGIAAMDSGPLRLTASLESDDPVALGRQIGLGEANVFQGPTMLVSLGLQGTPAEGLQGSFNASSDAESIGFAIEQLQAINGEIQGSGLLEVNLDDASALPQIIGAQGIGLPAVRGTARLNFEGGRLARLSQIAGTSADTAFSGDISLSRTGASAFVDGALTVDALSVEGLSAAIFGRTSLAPGASVWSDGPISVGEEPRSTRGAVAVSAGSVLGGGQIRLAETSFELSWDETTLRLGEFQGQLGDGTATLDLNVCCAGPLAEKTIKGRISLANAAINAIAPANVAASLGGIVEGGVQFEGTGSSLAEAIGVLVGEGTFTASDFSVTGLAPSVFPTVARLDDVLNTDADALDALIGLALGQGSFAAPTATGTFAIAGGVARMTNFIVGGAGGRLAGDLNLALTTLGLDGGFVLTPLGFEDPGGLVSNDTARIVTQIAGTLLLPEVTLDLAEMVAAIQVRANELEVDRLETLRAQDAERQRSAAEERNRLIEAQRQRAAAEAARLAQEEAARQAEQEAQRLEEEQLARELQQPQVPPATAPSPGQPLTSPLNLGFQPNQPFGPPASQTQF